MAKTILVGFEVRKGSFTKDGTGEVIEYDNRLLKFITDVAKKDCYGFDFFSVKLKTEDLVSCLRLRKDQTVDEVLKSTLNQEYSLDYAPVNGSMVCVGASPKAS